MRRIKIHVVKIDKLKLIEREREKTEEKIYIEKMLYNYNSLIKLNLY